MTTTWLELPRDCLFGPATLPYGVFSRGENGPRRIGVAIGDSVLDLAGAARVLGEDFAALVDAGVLNPLMAAGRPVWDAVRARITAWLNDPEYRPAVLAHLLPADGLWLHLPFEVADYVDFYASEQHARNAGRIFRPGRESLQPNWRHLPIGYHGRAGTVQVSSTPVVRPYGQLVPPGEETPVYGPTRKLDIEAEVGFVVGTPSVAGTRVPASAFADHVFGVCLVNDWSARDIQRYETVPLGPFLGKSFATSISPWVVPLAAFEHARVPAPEQSPEPAEYLRDGRDWGLDVTLEVRLNGHRIARPPFGTMYWTAAQQLAHLTVNGASLRTGDLYASGTVSGPDPDQWGSLLELSWDGTDPVLLADGSERAYLLDEDVVSITATAPGPDGEAIYLGEVSGRVVPAAH